VLIFCSKHKPNLASTSVTVYVTSHQITSILHYKADELPKSSLVCRKQPETYKNAVYRRKIAHPRVQSILGISFWWRKC